MYQHSDLTQRVIAAFYEVYSELGYGFLEKIYENAMAIVLRQSGHRVAQQYPIRVYFAGQVVGEYFADLVVDDLVIVELKATRKLADEHEAQLLNYLKATPFEVGLLLNFGPEPRVKRKVYSNERKPNLRSQGE